MEFKPLAFDALALSQYAGLFARCFPPSANFSVAYLDWLYCKNPDGLAIGFDAWDGDRLAAHYVCVPATVKVAGREVKALLSLNTATDPDYQGKGLFTQLAKLTYDAAAVAGVDCVFGVANANSTAGFVRKLGFNLVQALDARVGVGTLGVDWELARRNTAFARVWTSQGLQWRCHNPKNPVFLQSANGLFQCHAGAKPGLSAYAELDPQGMLGTANDGGRRWLTLRLFLGLMPAGACSYVRYVDIPQRLRPSPLNFIFRSLSSVPTTLEAGSVSFSFLDFDAY